MRKETIQFNTKAIPVPVKPHNGVSVCLHLQRWRGRPRFLSYAKRRAKKVTSGVLDLKPNFALAAERTKSGLRRNLRMSLHTSFVPKRCKDLCTTETIMHINYNRGREKREEEAHANADEFWIDGNGCVHRARQRLAESACCLTAKDSVPNWLGCTNAKPAGAVDRSRLTR